MSKMSDRHLYLIHLSQQKKGIFVASASLLLYSACRTQFNLRLKDTFGPNNRLLK